MEPQVYQDDMQRYQREKYEHRKAQLLQVMQDFLDEFGRDEVVTLVRLVRQASHEKVVVNNPMKTVRDAYETIKGVSF